MFESYLEDIWNSVFEGEEDSKGGGSNTDKGGESDTDKGGESDTDKGGESDKRSERQMTQEQVNKLVAEERKKWQSAQKKTLEELEALKAKAQLSDQERQEYDQRIEEINNALLTKEEVAKKEQEKLKKQSEEEKKQLQEEKESWQNRYTESRIQRSLTDAAVENNAFAPDQIVAILRPNTRLVEELDDDGKPTGEFIEKTKIKDIDEKGKTVELDLTVPEAVKKMSEMDKYLNLFKGSGSGGLGEMSKSGGNQPDLQKLAKDNPQEYIRLRKEGKISLQ